MILHSKIALLAATPLLIFYFSLQYGLYSDDWFRFVGLGVLLYDDD